MELSYFIGQLTLSALWQSKGFVELLLEKLFESNTSAIL